MGGSTVFKKNWKLLEELSSKAPRNSAGTRRARTGVSSHQDLLKRPKRPQLSEWKCHTLFGLKLPLAIHPGETARLFSGRMNRSWVFIYSFVLLTNI